jgi:hypothetical protein
MMQVRIAQVTLNSPKHRKAENLPEVTVWAIHTREVNPEKPDKPVEWLLLTTMPIHTFEEAKAMIQHYAVRWNIEIFHRVLKSLEVEESQLKNFKRLRRWVLINSILTWRVMQLTIFSRKYPNASCLEIFSAAEWEAIFIYRYPREPLPTEPPTAAQVVLELAKLGGFRARKCDGPPGPKHIHKGLIVLPYIITAIEASKIRFNHLSR